MSLEPLHSQTSQSDDEAAVRALYMQLMGGWNKGSGEAFAAPVAEDGHLVAFDCMRFKGRDEVEKIVRIVPVGLYDRLATVDDGALRTCPSPKPHPSAKCLILVSYNSSQSCPTCKPLKTARL